MKTNIRQFALLALEQAREDLQRDKYLIPVAFICKDDGFVDFTLRFEGEEEKQSVYSELIRLAKEGNAQAIITINDAHCIGNSSDDFLESYYHGKLAVERAPECIYLTVSGPAINTWSISVPYERKGEQIIFKDQVETTGDRLTLLAGWASSHNRIS
jgi:hypothetical protein